MVFFNKDWENLDNKIEKLERKIGHTDGLFSSYNACEFSDIFDLCKEINDDFKNVRYPTMQERSIAWQKFFNLRLKAYKERDRQASSYSSIRKDDIYYMLRGVEYHPIRDGLGKILTLGLSGTTIEEMKWAGRKLNEASAYFKTVKHEMTKEDKSEIYNRLVEIRLSHDKFWSMYKEISQEQYEQRRNEKQKAWEERQAAWESKKEKSQRIKSRIENNISSNKDKLRKAESALSRLIDNRRNLADKISESYNDDWKSKAEDWLDEMDDKIEDIKSHIERIEGWISEDEDKLNNWN